jgi:hypothetical protein
MDRGGFNIDVRAVFSNRDSFAVPVIGSGASSRLGIAEQADAVILGTTAA